MLATKKEAAALDRSTKEYSATLLYSVFFSQFIFQGTRLVILIWSMAWNTDGCFVSHASVKRHTPNWSCSRKTIGPLPRLNYEMDPVGKQCMSRHCITLWLAWPQWDSGTSLRKRTTRKSFPFAWWSWLVRKQEAMYARLALLLITILVIFGYVWASSTDFQ